MLVDEARQHISTISMVPASVMRKAGCEFEDASAQHGRDLRSATMHHEPE